MSHAIGTVYGVLLNDPATHERLGEQFNQDPYKAPPQAPVLYVKPANTFAHDGAAVPVPRTPGHVQIGATIGASIDRTASRVTKAGALSHVGGYRIVADVSLPHASYYRPAIRERCRDGFCPMSEVFKASKDFDVRTALITVSINGQIVEQRTLEAQVRPIDTLLCDVTDFMTLQQADVMLLGLSDQPPLAQPGDQITIDVAALGRLQFLVTLEDGEAS